MRRIAFLCAGCLMVLPGLAQKSPYQGVAPEDIIDGDYYLYNVETGLWLGDNATNKERYTSRAELGKRGFDVGVSHIEGGLQLNPKLGHNHSLNADNLYMDTGSGVTTWNVAEAGNGVSNGVRITSGAYTLGANASGLLVNNADSRNTWQFVTRRERMLTDAENASEENPVDMSWAIYGATFPVADERRSLWQGPWGSNSSTGDGYYRCNRIWEMWGIREMEVFQELTDLPDGRYTVSAQAIYSPSPNSGVSESHLDAYVSGTEVTAGYVFAGETRVPMKNIYTLVSQEWKENFNTKNIGNDRYMPEGVQQIANHMFDGQGITEEANVTVDGGKLRVGVGVKGGTGSSWIVFDNFNLTYLGPGKEQTEQPEELVSIADVEYREGEKAHLCLSFAGTGDVAFEHGMAPLVTVTDKNGKIVATGTDATNCYDDMWHDTAVRLTLSKRLEKGGYTVNIAANSLLLKELGYDTYRLAVSKSFDNSVCMAGDGDNEEPMEELVDNQTYADGIRIAWQYNSHRYFGDGSYGRAIRLKNGEYVMVYSTGGSNIGGNNFIRWQSTPYGDWTDATISRPMDAYHTNKNAEIIELKDGRLMYAWLYRTNYENSRGPSKIMAAYSTDGGHTWENEQVIYTATDTYGLGVWEPAMVQLPDGELQIYFANEASAGGGSQNISLRRSFNGGRSWQPGTEIVAYRAGSRDGMPVPVYLKNRKGIAVAIEDPGFMGTFKPMIVHTGADDNWASGTVDAGSNHRWSIFPSSNEYLASHVYCGQPYIIQLTTGETVYSAASGEDRNPDTSDTHGRMAVYVGDSNAKNFIARSFPFPFADNTGARAIWNSIMQYNDSTLMAVCTVEGNVDNAGIWTSEGKIMRPIASRQTGGELHWENLPRELFIGAESQAEARIRSLWDDRNLYFRFDVKDDDIRIGRNSMVSDGVEVYLTTSKPISDRSGQFRCFVDTKGRIEVKRYSGNGWVAIADTDITTAVTQSNVGYEVVVSIPWSEIGGIPAAGEVYCCYQLHNIDNRNGKTVTIHETLSGSDIEKSSTWMRMPLEKDPNVDTGVENVKADDAAGMPSAYYNIYGQRVSPDTCGIIITNGKKILNRTR